MYCRFSKEIFAVFDADLNFMGTSHTFHLSTTILVLQVQRFTLFLPAKTISVCLSETVKLKGKVTSPDSAQNLLSNLELEEFSNHSEMMAVLRRTFVKVVGRNVLSQHTNGVDWLCL